MGITQTRTTYRIGTIGPELDDLDTLRLGAKLSFMHGWGREPQPGELDPIYKVTAIETLEEV
jgi:hypothetical protein